MNYFPDDYYRVVSDDGSAHLDITIETAPWLADVPDLAGASFSEFGLLDGFGMNAGIFLRFTGPIAEPPTGAEASLSSDAVMLLELGDVVRRIPYRESLAMRVMTSTCGPCTVRVGAGHAVVITDAYLDADGGVSLLPQHSPRCSPARRRARHAQARRRVGANAGAGWPPS